MAMTDCIVSNRQQYVALTAGPGCEVGFGRVLRGQTGEDYSVLFENADEIHDRDRYFDSLAETTDTAHG